MESPLAGDRLVGGRDPRDDLHFFPFRLLLAYRLCDLKNLDAVANGRCRGRPCCCDSTWYVAIGARTVWVVGAVSFGTVVQVGVDAF